MEDFLFLKFRKFFFKIVIHNSPELSKRFKNDFSNFISKNSETHFDFCLNIFWQTPPLQKIPPMKVKFQRSQCMTYDVGGIRYNDYYGKVLTISDFKQNNYELYSEEIHRAHEVGYLLILSLIGKAWDEVGLHRLHAFGLVKNQVALLGTMSMKGGKSTLFCELVKDEKCEILSDDSPVIDRRGRVYPFALRAGMDAVPDFLRNQKEEVIELMRNEYGLKYLIPLKLFKNNIAHANQIKKVILFRAKRSTFEKTKIKKCPKIYLLNDLFINLIIGIGLPMIKEYYLRPGLRDIYVNSLILISRAISTIMLLARSSTYEIIWGQDKKERTKTVTDLWEHYQNELSLTRPVLQKNV